MPITRAINLVFWTLSARRNCIEDSRYHWLGASSSGLTSYYGSLVYTRGNLVVSSSIGICLHAISDFPRVYHFISLEASRFTLHVLNAPKPRLKPPQIKPIYRAVLST